jgi:hypothetical protein
LITGTDTPDDQGLHDTLLSQRACKLLDFALLEVLTWLVRIGIDAIDFDFGQAFPRQSGSLGQ